MNKYIIFSIFISAALFIGCAEESKKSKNTTTTVEQKDSFPNFQNKAHELVYQMTQKVGDYSKLANKKDVIYTYTYKTPDGKTDVSTEKYIFNDELSYGAYSKHERTLKNLKGLVEQGYDGKEYWLKNEGQIITDTTALKRVAFNRPTNYYWFTMMQKLLDPGLQYEYIKEQKLDTKIYDIVKVTFESKDDTPKDIYQLYINRDTKLVDQFLFTVMDFGRTEPMLMKMEYENIDGILIPTKRRYKSSNWEAEETKDEWILVNWTDIKFDNNLKPTDFKK
nr:DUF6503 family protein [uncultured Psychroserpens sp.]